MAARVVLACWGSFGDLFPTLGVAHELKRRGHHPVVATCHFYRDIVQAQHLDFAPIRPDLDPDDTALIARVMDPKQGTEVILREMLVPFVREAYEDTEAASAGADLIVSHPVTFTARMVAERLSLPWLSTVLAPTSFFSLHDFPLLPPHPRFMRVARVSPWVARGFMAMARSVTRSWLEPVVEFRASLGLPPAGDPLYEGQFSPLGTLALFSRVMAEPQPDWPARTTLCGFVFHDTFGEMPPDLAAFLDAGDPPVVFTLGTSAVGAPGAFYRESARAAAMASRRAVLLVGRQADNTPPALTADAIAVEYAPHAALFARAAAVVHQGGAGTTAQALRAARPMLVVPHAHDQPDNAARVERFGVARVEPAATYDAARAARHLASLLDSSEVARRAAEAAAIVRAERGAAAAADAIEAALR